MSRFLLSAASIFVLLSSMIPSQVIAARRCGERMPITLLALYRDSDAIFVGRYEKTEDGAPTEETADYTVFPIKKHFTISSALKGESRKLFTLEDTEYRYKNQEVASESEEHEEEESDETVLSPGDSVLLFLKEGDAPEASEEGEEGEVSAVSEETETLELTDYTDGIKKMTPDKLSSYEARIRELNGIFSSEKPKHSQVVAWLIRCAEDPNTRWEGTFELLQSFQNMDWQDEQAKEVTAKPADVEAEKEAPAEGESAPEASEEPEADAPRDFETGDANIARNVTDAHKTALTNILLNRPRPKKSADDENETSSVYGDEELVELVKRWGDSRVAEHLVEELRGNAADASVSADLMASIASMLHDEELDEVSARYYDIQWEADEIEVPSETGTDTGVAPPSTLAEEAVAPPEEAVAPAEEAVAAPEGEATEEAEPGSAKKRTYADLRSELFTKFLTRADKVIAVERSKANAKADAKAGQ